jgi:two-component system, response regulator PdtaR
MKALRVLLIENETVIALLFAEVLKEMGHIVCGYEMTQDGAIAAAAHLAPDLIVADVRLLEGSGIEAVNAILQTGFVPHVFVSGDILDPKSLNPAAVVLRKPFYEAQLVQAIGRAIDPANMLIGKAHAENLHRT